MYFYFLNNAYALRAWRFPWKEKGISYSTFPFGFLWVISTVLPEGPWRGAPRLRQTTLGCARIAPSAMAEPRLRPFQTPFTGPSKTACTAFEGCRWYKTTPGPLQKRCGRFYGVCCGVVFGFALTVV